MRPSGQNINRGVPRASAFMRDIVDSSVAGSTNDAVFRFNDTNDAVVGEGLAIVNSVADGDSILCTRSGIYLLTLVFSAAASDGVDLGISQDVAAGGLTGDPVMTLAGMLTVGGLLNPAANTAVCNLTAIASITAADAAGNVVFRAHGTDSAGGVVADAAILLNTDCYFQVVKIAELNE